MIFNKKIGLFSLLITINFTSALLHSAASSEKTQLRLQAALDRLTTVTKPTSVEIKAYQSKSNKAMSRKIAKAITIQYKIMDLAIKLIEADKIVLSSYFTQESSMQKRKCIITSKRSFRMPTHKSAEAIAFELHYDKLLSSSPHVLSSEYPELISEFELNLPSYLTSGNAELIISAQFLKSRIDLGKAGTMCCATADEIASLWNEFLALNLDKRAIIQYPTILARNLNQTMKEPGDTQKEITELERVYAHFQKNKAAIQMHLQAITSPERQAHTQLPEWATESSKKKKSVSKRSAKTVVLSPSKALSQAASSEPTLDIAVIDEPSVDIFSPAASSSAIAPLSRTASSADFIMPDAKNDGSYVKTITNTTITIDDPKNNAVIKLFRIQNPTAPIITEIILAFNIKLWMADSNLALEELGYTTPGHKNYNDPQAYTYLRRIHSFGLAADDYVSQCGIAQEGPDRINPEQINTMILMPGSYSYDDEQGRHVEKIGLFTYVLNRKTNKIFHRMFHAYKAKNLIKEYNEKGIWNITIDQL